MRIYTRTGDSGDTGLFGGGRVPKDDPRVEAYGDVDELNAVIGMARAVELMPRIDELLVPVQRDLFAIGALLATPDRDKMAQHLEKARGDVGVRLDARPLNRIGRSVSGQVDRHHAQRAPQAAELVDPVARTHPRTVDQKDRRPGPRSPDCQIGHPAPVRPDELTRHVGSGGTSIRLEILGAAERHEV